MRDIKFRAWDEMQKIMHNKFQFIRSGTDGNDWIVFMSDKQDSYDHAMRNPFFSQQLKIMQFTGLQDRNGKDIYEGDIITATYGIGEVEFNLTTCSYKYVFSLDSDDLWLYSSVSEIIGNIYENPELLNQ